MPRPSVAIRIGTEGKSAVVNDFAEIGQAGEAAAQRWGRRFEEQSAIAERATRRAAEAAARVAAVMPESDVQARIAAVTQSGGGQSAQDSARFFADMEQRSRALLVAIDPLYAAQQRFNMALTEARTLLAAGAVSTEQFALAETVAQRELDATVERLNAHGHAARGSNIAQMELMHVVRGSADSFAAGMPPMMIFTQHLGMLAQAASYGGEQMGAFGRFMGGGWGLALTVGITLLGTLIASHSHAAESAHQHETAEEALTRALAGEQDAITKVVEAMQQRNNQVRETMALDVERFAQQQQMAQGDIQVARQQLAQRQAELEGARSARSAALLMGNTTQFSIAEQAIRSLPDEIQRLQTVLAADQSRVIDLDIQRSRRLTEPANRLTDQFGIIAHNFENAIHRALATLPANPRDDNPQQAAARLNIRHSMDVGERSIDEARRRGLAAVQQMTAEERRLADTRDTGRHVTVAQARSIVEGIGGHVNSGQRPTWIRDEVPGGPSSQERLYNLYRSGHGNPAAAPGHSLHESGRALDVRPGPGINNATLREAFRRQGVTAQSFWENDHFHVSFNGEGRAPGAGHAETMARQSESRDADIHGQIALANAYLLSADAAARAQATRQGLVAATRQGTDAAARERQQLDLNSATQIAEGAHAVLQLREETGARAEVDRQVAAGTLAAGDMRQAMEDEARLRPLLALQAVAHGEALATLNRAIVAYRDALQSAHAEEAHGDALGAIAQLRVANDNARGMLAFGGSDQERAIETARRAALQTAAEKHYAPDDSTAFVAQSVDRERLSFATQIADQVRRTNAEQDDRNALLAYELRLGGIGEQQRQNAVRIEEQRLQLERQFGPLHEAEIQQILDKARAEQELQRHLQLLNASMQEVNQFGGQFIDEVLNVQNWSDWGAMGKRVLQELLQEMITLAAINPLKNMLLGQNNPTLSSVGGILGSLFGGGAGSAGVASAGAAVGTFDPIIGFASGTDSAPGGVAWVGEEGPELMDVPRGARIIPAAESRRLAAANDGGLGGLNLTMHNDFRGADMQAVSAISARIDRFEQEFRDRVVNAMANARSRFVWR